VPALAAWVAVGLLAEWRGRIAVAADAELAPQKTPAAVPAPATPPAAPVMAGSAGVPPASIKPAGETLALPPVPARELAPPPPPKPDPVWMKITAKDWEELDYNVPPDHGIVSPMAGPDEEPEDFMKEQTDAVRNRIATWGPGTDGDDLRCIRNLLYIAAVPDAIQLPVERYLPRVVYNHLVDSYPKDKLLKILTYIAQHPMEGPVIDDISDLGIEGAAGDPMMVRERAYLYAIKYIARLSGRVQE